MTFPFHTAKQSKVLRQLKSLKVIQMADLPLRILLQERKSQQCSIELWSTDS